MKIPRETLEAIMSEPLRAVSTLPKRKTGGFNSVPSGHAARPGTGPANMRCKDCHHYTIVQRNSITARKCGANSDNWTRSRRTDIRARDPACRFFKEERHG